MNKGGLDHLFVGFWELRCETAKEYICPVCNQVFQQEPKIWEHAHRNAEYSRDTSQPSAAKPISSSPRTHGSGKDIQDIVDLSLEQATSDEQKAQPISVQNPRKRGAGVGTGSSDPRPQSQGRQLMRTTPRHRKFSSGGKHVEVLRHDSPSNDPEYKRGKLGSKQSLWDPLLDSAKNPKGVREKIQHVQSDRRDRPAFQEKEVTVTNINPRGWYDRAHSERPIVNQGFHDSRGQEKVLSPTGHDHDKYSSESLPEDDTYYNGRPENPETDVEMLLQPETRPISHDQLVVEVQGIYAGLVMVEAKCIDIDKKQAAAAQDRNPSKQSDLKHNQWQSLIALHKQVLGVDIYFSMTGLSLI